jgi:hypothetical protein
MQLGNGKWRRNLELTCYSHRVEETASFGSSSSNHSRHNGQASGAVHSAVLAGTKMQQSPILPLSPSSYAIPALPVLSQYQENGHGYNGQPGIPGKSEFLSAFSTAFDAFWAPMEQARTQIDASITRADALLGTLGAAGEMVEGLVKGHFQVVMRDWSGQVGRALTDLDQRLQVLEQRSAPAQPLIKQEPQVNEDLLRQIEVLTHRIAHLEARTS